MSEEEKQMFNKMIYCNLINGEQALKFNRKYEDLQQKVEQLEKENKRLKKWKDDLLSENIELENIRKEAIEELSYMSTDAYVEDYDIREKHYNLLMNILNKGGISKYECKRNV